MGKEKKQFGSMDRNSKNNPNKNIRKDQPLNQKNKDSPHYSYNQRNANYNRASDKKTFNSL